jgi:hypothetical protein
MPQPCVCGETCGCGTIKISKEEIIKGSSCCCVSALVTLTRVFIRSHKSVQSCRRLVQQSVTTGRQLSALCNSPTRTRRLIIEIPILIKMRAPQIYYAVRLGVGVYVNMPVVFFSR